MVPQRLLIGCRLYQRRGAVDRQLYCQFTARFVTRGRSLATRPVAGGLVDGHGGVAPERALHGRQCRRRREVRSRRVTARRAAGQGPGRRRRGVGGAGWPTRHGGQQRRAAAPSALRVAGGGGWRARPSSSPPRPRLKVSALCSRRLRAHAKPRRRFPEWDKASPAWWAWVSLVLKPRLGRKGFSAFARPGHRLALPGFARSPHSALVRLWEPAAEAEPT